MSLYNLIHGMNAMFIIAISAIVGERFSSTIPRFRDMFKEDDSCPFNDYDYLIYTRMGSGNYQCWNDGVENCNCGYCQLKEIEKRPTYIGGYDHTEWDATFRTLAFKFTPEQKELFDKIMEVGHLQPIKEQIKAIMPEAYEKIFKGKEVSDDNQ